MSSRKSRKNKKKSKMQLHNAQAENTATRHDWHMERNVIVDKGSYDTTQHPGKCWVFLLIKI